MKKILLILSSFLLFSACSSYYTSNGDENYLKARNGSKLVVPSPLTQQNVSGFYVLPPQNESPQVSIKPPQN